MSLALLSGRPGTGKTAFAHWLAKNRGFTHVETDAEWSTWGPLVCVQNLEEAIETRNRALSLGQDVIVEWGFKVALLDCVRYLRGAGFECWWFDGDEEGARQGYINRRGDSPPVMTARQVQVNEIQAAWPQLERFYGDHIIRTVSPGPIYMAPDDIVLNMFAKSGGSGDDSHD